MWMRAWAQRITPQRFKLLGGEPMLHRDLWRYVRLTYQLWPHADRSVTTNGLVLNFQNLTLANELKNTGTRVYLTRHHETDREYLSRLAEAEQILKDWGVEYEVDPTTHWYKSYEGRGDDIKPFDSDPEEAWNRCDSRWCMQLHDNRLWKCPVAAYWGMYLEKFPGANRPEWDRLTNYRSIGLGASDEELGEFAVRTHEPMCRVCPSNPQTYQKEIWPN